jgi:uncharacterized Zn finger protein
MWVVPMIFCSNIVRERDRQPTHESERMNSTPAGAIKRSTLRRLAGVTSFGRGEDYFASGRVRSLAEYEGTITARVVGNDEYRVKLYAADDLLEYSCSCPVGSEGDFCKHCVAVGLAWLDETTAGGSKSDSGEKPVTMDEVRTYLVEQDKERLADMLVRQAMEDESLRRRLVVEAARGQAPGTTLATYRNALRGAIEIDEFVSYYEVYDYMRGIDECVGMLQELLGSGHPIEVIELCEYALELFEDAIGSVDDSGGQLGYYSEKIQELHHTACKKARPDPVELAERLIDWELSSEWDTFYGAGETYADVLGKKGLATYRELAEQEWERVPALGPGDDRVAGYDRKRFGITHIMEGLARQAGGIEELVEVKKRDLTSQYAFLQIADIYKQAGRHDQAIEWAERGLAAFPGRPDSRLSEFLAVEYHRCKRHDEAMALVWARFEDMPDLDRYQNLKKHADLTGKWPAWRKKALARMRKSIADEKREAQASRWSRQRADNSRLVEVFLWEKDVEAAWREAREGGCSDDLWMKMAVLREPKHPEDSLEVYRAQVEPLINQKNNDSYRDAVELLRKVRGIMKRLDQESEFAQYVESVRAAHRRKRNLMKLLDAEKWA